MIIQWVQSFSFARLKNSRDLLQNSVHIVNIIVHLKVKVVNFMIEVFDHHLKKLIIRKKL